MQRLSPRFRSEKYFVYEISEDFRTTVGRNVLRESSDEKYPLTLISALT